MKIKELIRENQQIVDASHIYSIVKKIHRNFNDFDEGDITDRIYWFDQYKLVNFPLSKLNLNEWDVNEDLVADNIAKIMKSQHTMPPVVIDPFTNSIIDGTHRANAYAKLGYDTIPAYIGSIKSSSYGEHESPDDEY